MKLLYEKLQIKKRSVKCTSIEFEILVTLLIFINILKKGDILHTTH